MRMPGLVLGLGLIAFGGLLALSSPVVPGLICILIGLIVVVVAASDSGHAPDLSPAELRETTTDVARRAHYQAVERAHGQPAKNREDVDDGEDHYDEFVAAMWQRAGIQLGGLRFERLTGPVAVSCDLVSLVTGDNGARYLNVLEGGVRKTYSADGRHRWRHDGHDIDAAAFAAIARGAPAQEALRADPYPSSFEEAISPRCDRFPTKDQRPVISYEDSRGQLSYRVISRVVRQRDTFSARCHFRWGERRTFLFDGVRSVVDVETGEVVSLAKFRTPKRKTRSSKRGG